MSNFILHLHNEANAVNAAFLFKYFALQHLNIFFPPKVSENTGKFQSVSDQLFHWQPPLRLIRKRGKLGRALPWPGPPLACGSHQTCLIQCPFPVLSCTLGNKELFSGKRCLTNTPLQEKGMLITVFYEHKQTVTI